jgi:hypothetical protein
MEAARRDARSGGKPVTLNDAYDTMDKSTFEAVVLAVVSGVSAVMVKADPN